MEFQRHGLNSLNSASGHLKAHPIWALGNPVSKLNTNLSVFLGMGRSFAEGGIDKTPIIEGYVRLRQFLGRALRLGWARGPSATASTG